jgi:REP element-mobilizing transposase RayT
MARQKREVSKTGVYHILLRGVNSLFLFDSDFENFLSILKEKTKSQGIKIFAYMLLENRVHMVVDAKDKNIGTVLKPVCTSYARYCNRTRGVSGKLFYDRFKSEPINSKDELLEVVSFINFIAKGHKNSRFSSFENPLCTQKESGMTEKQSKSTEFTELFMEEYDCLSKAELISYIYAVCGVKDFKTLPLKKQSELIDKITKDRRISKSKVYEVFGLKKPQRIKPKKEKQESFSETKKEQPKKKDLSVWLL